MRASWIRLAQCGMQVLFPGGVRGHIARGRSADALGTRGEIERARWTRAGTTGAPNALGLGQFELGIVGATGKFDPAEGRGTAAGGRVAPRYPNAVDFDAALDGSDAEWDIVVFGDHRLGLQHLGRLRFLALVDLCVFAYADRIISQFTETEQYRGHLWDCQHGECTIFF